MSFLAKKSILFILRNTDFLPTACINVAGGFHAKYLVYSKEVFKKIKRVK